MQISVFAQEKNERKVFECAQHSILYCTSYLHELCTQHMTDCNPFPLQSATTHMCTRLAPLAVITLLLLPPMWQGPPLRGLTPQDPTGPTQGQL